MSVTEAEEFCGAGEARPPAAHTILDRLAHVGARGGDCHGRPWPPRVGVGGQPRR
ncbi:MAG TPA: hypothetical protein VN748_15600 [Pseudonocardiaceae bacterium]|jgi:hypothetical protein|nr:hypothetical protein [Pseudonocardiaceae bacterium]